MVDPIGTKAVTSDPRVAAVARAAPTPVAAPGDNADPAPVPSVTTLASTLAASPPVDLDRVARIKKAVADGDFPIYPATIADRLIALKYDWNPHDDAA